MSQPIDRRTLLKTTATAATLLSTGSFASARGSDTIRVGVIGCGGRGTGAAANCVASAPGVEIVAMGDLFEDRLRSSRERLGGLGESMKATDETCFHGFDAFHKVLATDVDLVILATPPHFRPEHLRASIEAGKHVFMEKPVAVDPTGVRSVIESADMAGQKGLGIVAGTQRRHQASYLESMKRIEDGAIGEIVSASCHWNQGGLWMHQRKDEWSDTEWQLRNWLYFTWLSGDHIVEQHIHNIDVMNWALGSTPVRATGMGGREVRTDPAYGNVFDHFAIEYEYPSGVIAHSYCRQIDNTANRVGERIVGTKGVAEPAAYVRGATEWRWEGGGRNPYEQEHTDLIESIRAGTPLNEGKRVAESTMTAILGRMSAYTGRSITWEDGLQSKLDLAPEAYVLGDMSVRPTAVPGVTEFV